MKRWVIIGSLVVAAAFVWWFGGAPDVPTAGGAGRTSVAGVVLVPDQNGGSEAGPVADDGGGVEVLRIEFLEKVDRPAGPLVAVHDELVERAAGGDAVAAFELYRGLQYCRSAAASEADLEARIEHLRTARRIGPVAIEDPEPMVASSRERFAYCDGVTDAMEDKYYGWLRYSAELGLLQAAVRMGAEAHPESWDVDIDDPANAQRVAELRADWVGWQRRAAAAGSVEAMRALSHSYRGGVVIDQDLERAYAYRLAALTVREAAGVSVADERLWLERLEGELRPWQLESARRQAAEILADPACCKL